MPDSIRPFLKWPGGKRWLVPYVRQLLKDEPIRRYLEPFLGGGAMFFGLRPQTAILSDINPDLINVYIQVKLNAASLVDELKALPVDAETYWSLRWEAPANPRRAAVRFLYLNRTAFGGMYRLNRRGQFNVPYGGGERTPALLWTEGLLTEAAVALAVAKVRTADFARTIGLARIGDVVYCDPTYTATHNRNGFVRYNERNFSWADQLRLAGAAERARRRGALVLVSNAAHGAMPRLYPKAEVLAVDRWCGVCPEPSARRRIEEFLLVLRPEP